MAASEQIIVVTTDRVPGRSVRETLGMVWGIGITNRHSDKRSRIEDAADDARHRAYNNLVKQARAMDADAVVGVGSDSFVMLDGDEVYREYTFYGTAVRLD